MRRIFAAETPEYFALLGTTIFLVIFGLVMVLSSSAVESQISGGGFFARFAKQGMFALIGVPLMLILARISPRFWQKWAWVVLGGAIVLQLLVFLPGISYNVGGNTNWIKIGTITAQPSEFLKLALIVWIASVVARKAELLRDWKHVLIPIVPVTMVAIGLVLKGQDLGTAMILFGIALGALFFGGVRLHHLIVGSVLVGVVGYYFASQHGSRTHRIAAFLNGCQDPKYAATTCYQTIHGWWALAQGGVVGVGLGNSTEKWGGLPEAYNDFIFAIIGNELGLVGAVLVLALFLALAFCFIRIIRMQRRSFPIIVTGAVMVWVIGQAFVNIGVVLGILPVLGVPLPLVSAGGTALISTLAAIGIVLSFARARPDDPGALR